MVTPLLCQWNRSVEYKVWSNIYLWNQRLFKEWNNKVLWTDFNIFHHFQKLGQNAIVCSVCGGRWATQKQTLIAENGDRNLCSSSGFVTLMDQWSVQTNFTVVSKERNWYAQSVWKISFISNQPVTLHAYVGVDLNAFVFMHACINVQWNVGGTFLGLAGMQAERFQL